MISQKVVLSHGYYCFDVQNGQKSFSLGFPEKYEAVSWLEVLLEVAGKKSIHALMHYLCCCCLLSSMSSSYVVICR